MSQVGSVGNQLAGSDWVELMVREMMSAADVEDARSRTARVLKAFEKVVQQQGEEKAATFLGTLRKVTSLQNLSCRFMTQASTEETRGGHEFEEGNINDCLLSVDRFESLG